MIIVYRLGLGGDLRWYVTRWVTTVCDLVPPNLANNECLQKCSTHPVRLRQPGMHKRALQYQIVRPVVTGLRWIVSR